MNADKQLSEGPPKPAKRKKTDSSTDTEDLVTTEIKVSVLDSINNKLDILGIIHEDIKELRSGLDFAYQQISVETIKNFRPRSMRDNLIFSGIPENDCDNPESTIKHVMRNELKLPADTVNNITFHRAHRLGKRLKERPRPIIAKFVHFKQKELVKSKGREIKRHHFPDKRPVPS
ncbi:hypothetical protein H4Q32_029823 [Labeo rohita]|uniref:Uncharacterized protein n=1 Tax=Labeo rohita TaxID=84645 RepID=A0ABQ8M141_LABRO|nr:hypothetical protein H4Q32_029823 [Labeo rohita]